ncbi:hypothetical protein, partial [uncultured Capnocytophaga sp.]|uniref:hypothetical protein n=1 Tax=uncultured Capnocytophaga sp. TaxID=159273 RepID=UPI00260CADAE
MTALEAFNALDNREVSRKEVEQVLAQAKAENNTAIIYRLSRVLNDSPEATHFEITITHYDSSVGLSGVQHTGDYREALDDCGRLKKGWKFVKGNVVKVEEKPKKEAKPKKEKAPQKEETTKEVSDPKVKNFEAFDNLQAQLLAENADIPESEVLDFLYNFTDAFEEGKTVFRFWNTPGKKPTEAVLQYKKHPLLTRLQNPSAKMRAYELTPRGYELLEKFHKGVERIKKTYDLGYITGIHKLYNFLRDRKAYVKKEEAKGKETTNPLTKFREQAKEFHQKEKAPKSLKFSDIDYNKSLIESFTDKNTETNRLFVKDHSLGLTFSFSPVEKYMATEQIFTLYGKDRKEEAEKDFLRMKEEIAWAFNHHVKTAQREGTLEECKKYFLENLPELLAKGGLWLEAKAKNKGTAARSDFTKLRKQVWKDIGALAVGNSVKNVENSSKKKVEKAPAKATKSLKLRKEKGENVANFTLLQEPTKVETKKGKDKEGEQKELDLYMQEMKMAIKESKAGKFDKKNILSWLSKFPDKVKGLLYNFLYHHYLLDQEEAKLRKSKKMVPFGLISVQAGISEFVSKLMDLEREDFFDLYFFFRDNMDECIELLEDKEVKKNYYEKKKKGLSSVDYSQGLFGDIGLNAPRHEGILKEALNDCGRLKKGWKFEKGKAVKIDTKTKKEKGSKESRKKIKIIPPYIGDIEYNEEGDNYIALEKELGDIMGAKFDQWQKEIIAHNREKKLEMYSKEIWKKIDAEKDTKEDVYVGDYEPDEKGFYYEIRQIGKKKYRLELSVHRYGRFSVYPTAIEDFKSLKQCGDFLIKTLDKSNGFYYTNMLGLSQLQNKINELKGYQYSKQIHFEDEDEGLTGAVPEVST